MSLILLAACATPQKVECACICPPSGLLLPAPMPSLENPLMPWPPSINGLPCVTPDGGNICIIPVGAL